MTAVWKQIPCFPLYEASTDGLIRRIKTGKVLQPTLSDPAYYVVGLYKEGSSKVYAKRVHSLIAETFLGPRPSGLYVLHGPGGALDNRLANLSYGTHKQNMLDKERDGTAPVGSFNAAAKLTEGDIPVIRQRAQRETHQAIAADYGCSRSAISLAVRGETWTHV